jgi:hypothetical protein
MAQMTHKKFCEMIERLCTLSELIAWEQAGGTPHPEIEKRDSADRKALKDKILQWSASTATLPGEIQ